MKVFHSFCSLGFKLGLVLIVLAGLVSAQTFDGVEKGRHKDMLRTIKNDIKKNYYDPSFHGLELDAAFKAAEEKMDQATSTNQAEGIIAQAVLNLNDSHTFFLPPQKTTVADYGWEMSMIGDKCFVTGVKPGSPAEASGLKAGDEIVAVENFRPTRKELWKVRYYYYGLSPRRGLQLLIQSPGDKEPRQLNVPSKLKQLKRVMDLSTAGVDFWDLVRDSEGKGETHRFQTVGGTIIWKMPSFGLAPQDVDNIMRNRINGKGALVLDLRGNGGGLVLALQQLAGYFFDKEIKIADLKGRKEEPAMKTKPQSAGQLFTGKVIVLVDHDSASCSEVFARLMQIEKRGTVIGDKSAGAVMQARHFSEQAGTDRLIFYGVSVTDADVIMSDGASLENIGVTPDELLLPTGTDLAGLRDPVLAKALSELGQEVSPEAAGKLFPIEWDDNK